MLTGLYKTRANSKRHYIIVMAFAILLFLAIFVVEPYIRSYFLNSNSESVVVTDQIEPQTNGDARSAPVRLVIPAISLDTTFVTPLGLLPDQTVSVPNSYTEVGWYSGGVSPGEVGSSVILGHVDSVDGPAIFYGLGRLKIGDEIEITRDDSTIVTFVVTKLQRYPQSNFPTLEVYGPTDASELRLVTCTGIFNKGEQKYSHNLVVFAKLK